MDIIVLLLGIIFTLSLLGIIENWREYGPIATGICMIIYFIGVILLIGAL